MTRQQKLDAISSVDMLKEEGEGYSRAIKRVSEYYSVYNFELECWYNNFKIFKTI